jgi:hypothetical protein
MNTSQCGNNYAVHRRRCFESLMISSGRMDLDVGVHTVRKRGRCRNVAPKVVNASKFAFPIQSDDDWSFSKSDASSLKNPPKRKQYIESQEGPHPRSSLKRRSGSFRILRRCDDRWARRSQRKLQTSSRGLYSTPPLKRQASCVQVGSKIIKKAPDQQPWVVFHSSSQEASIVRPPLKRQASCVQFHGDDNHAAHPTKSDRGRRRMMKSPQIRSMRSNMN